MINLSIADADNILRPRITVMGVGGAGGNAVNNMIRSSLEGCDFVAANTDAQALANSLAPRKIQLGITQTRGLGAGSRPDVGRGAAEEQTHDILSCLEQTDMLFITAGMGGGTGTGAAPVIARLAREAGILTVGVVTRPFDFEGNKRRALADQGISDLQQFVDTLIIIPNQNLFRMANERTTFADAFRLADEVLHCGVRGITDLMVMPGFMNLDFADVKTVMAEMGKAMMGTGEAEGENRALRAAEAAISNPLLEDTSMKGAKGVLINITGGLDLTLFEVDQAANRIREEVDPEAQIKVGSTLSENLEGVIRVSVIATGIEAPVQMVPPVTTTQTGSTGGMTPPTSGGLRSGAVPPNPGLAARPSFNNAYYMAPQQAPAVTSPIAAAVTSSTAEPPASPQNHEPEAAPVAVTAAPPAPPINTGLLRGQQVGGQFVAPRPMEAPRQTQPLPQTWQPPATAPASGSAVTAEAKGNNRRADSLFTRITGFGMVRPSSEMAPGTAPQQQRPGIDTTTERPAGAVKADDEEDLLEIPTFLRRQSNH